MSFAPYGKSMVASSPPTQAPNRAARHQIYRAVLMKTLGISAAEQAGAEEWGLGVGGEFTIILRLPKAGWRQSVCSL